MRFSNQTVVDSYYFGTIWENKNIRTASFDLVEYLSCCKLDKRYKNKDKYIYGVVRKHGFEIPVVFKHGNKAWQTIGMGRQYESKKH